MKMEKKPKAVTVSQFMQMYSIGRSQVYKMIEEGRLVAIDIGFGKRSTWRIDVDASEKKIEEDSKSKLESLSNAV